MKGSEAEISRTARNEVRTYKDIRADYTFNPDVFNDEPDRIRIVKEIIAKDLTEVERTILLLYIDCLSYRKLGKRMHLSHMTVRREVIRIRDKVMKLYNERIR